MRKHNIILVFISISLVLQIFLHSNVYGQKADVLLFLPGGGKGGFSNLSDIESYEKIAKKLGLSTSQMGEYSFINERESLFDDQGQLKFKVLIVPGGIPREWFGGTKKNSITCQGVKNILSFIESGGSVICICFCGNALFVKTLEWLCSTRGEIGEGKYDEYYVHRQEGHFKEYCGVYAFKGVVRGPQKSNMEKIPGLPPYPRIKFLPITMNPKNEIVREANLPSVIHQVVVGGGSIIPDKDQPLDVVGWYPNGTAAIGIAPYGKGIIIMSNPHPNISGRRADHFKKSVMGIHARNWKWTDAEIAEGQKLIQNLNDPDGPMPDWALAKAMLSYAYKKALQQSKKDF